MDEFPSSVMGDVSIKVLKEFHATDLPQRGVDLRMKGASVHEQARAGDKKKRGEFLVYRGTGHFHVLFFKLFVKAIAWSAH